MVDPNGSASLKYLFGPSASVNLIASYSVEEPNFSETLTQTTLRTRIGLEFKDQVTRRLATNLALNYNHDENTGLLTGTNRQNSTQNGLELLIEAKYAVTNRVALDLKFDHTELDSIGGYSRDVYTAGMAFSF